MSSTFPPSNEDTQPCPMLNEFDLNAMGALGVDLSTPEAGFVVDLLSVADDADP